VAQEDWPIAKENISFHGVLAHAKGDRVPPDNVKANGWESLVVKPDTKAAEKAAADAAESV
jgi:hypothetical protein